MRFNPCGQAVANLRQAYRTTCRPFRDSDQTVTIRWYPCHPGAKVLGIESPFSSQRWKAYPYLLAGVGEVYGAPVEVLRPVSVPGADGQHRCGTDADFRYGGEYRPELPPVEYSPDGLPLCCGPDPGGLLVGGEEPDTPTIDGGASCPLAGLLTPGIEYLSPAEVWPIPWTGYRWYRSADTVSGSVRIRVTSTDPLNPSNGGAYLRGADCGSLVGMGSWIGDTFDLAVNVAPASYLYIAVSAPGAAAPPAIGPGFTIRLD